MQDVIKRIHDYALEDIMGDRFGRYAKTIIQDRAIPDVRDGLKPVQRRILYAMFRAGNTYDKGYIKCASTVGDVLGKFHPHGDSSVYDAMVRMSQWWKQSHTLIDIHGNNGSMDGDPPAAYRYTEARLAKISHDLLGDLEKDTVNWAPNFDDRFLEPTVLPAKFPNLLVNGTNGISAGYATNIPPHNLGEVIDATIKRIDSPNCHLDTILDIIKGPDFPTGGIAEGKEGIKDAFTKGKGKVIVRAKLEFAKEKNKQQIIVTEIPFEVNKALLVKKIDEIRIDKKVDGITEVRDESDREGLRIAIDLKKDADRELILNYLYKNTDLQVSYNYNMVAIVNRRPMTLGILSIIDAYIAHQKECITRRTQFDLDHAKAKYHILEGLIKAMSILDEVIAVIRASKNKGDAIDNLVAKFAFTKEQAKAIVELQLYRLTNTDVVEVETQMAELQKNINIWTQILNNEEALKHVMKTELKIIKKEYAVPRKTEIKDEVTEIKIDTTKMLPKEDCIVVVTKEGYVKRVSLRSYNKEDQTTVKDGDYVIGLYQLNTMDTVLIFTNLGNYLYVPVHELPELKWKELGKHISNIIKISADEHLVAVYPVKDFTTEKYITIFTKNGMVKKTKLEEFKVQRYSKPMTCIKLKTSDDEVVSVCTSDGDDIFIATYNGYGLRYKNSEVPVTGVKSSGVKAITLKNDYVVSGNVFDADKVEYITLFTTKNTAKRIKITDFEPIARGRKGLLIIREVKTNPYYIKNAFVLSHRANIIIKTTEGFQSVKITELPITDRYSTGASVSKHTIYDVYVEKGLVNLEHPLMKEESKVDEDVVSLEHIDEQIMTIDDFLDDFEI
ncbi:MAG: DNA topoisomerase IV subunit A [Bacilli bacterium]